MEVKRKKDNHLAHHGVKGQKWGVRRWQNEDGTLTAAGRKHYGYSDYSSYVEDRVKKAKTSNEKSYVLRSEARRNVQNVATKAVATGAASAIPAIAGLGLGMANVVSGGTLLPATIASMAASTLIGAAGSAITIGSAYVNIKKNIKVANIADKYGIEDYKSRSVK